MRSELRILLVISILTLVGHNGASQERHDPMPSKRNHVANRNVYHGPTSLGPLSIAKGEGEIDAESLRSKLGAGVLPKTDLICYHDQDSETYLIVERATDDRRMVRGLTLSRLNVCPGETLIPAKGFCNWSTDQGIHLGSSERDVFLKYGKPSSVDEMREDPGFYPYPMRKERSEHLRQGRILNYRAPDGIPNTSHAFFGVRDGVVAWMTVSDNE